MLMPAALTQLIALASMPGRSASSVTARSAARCAIGSLRSWGFRADVGGDVDHLPKRQLRRDRLHQLACESYARERTGNFGTSTIRCPSGSIAGGSTGMRRLPSMMRVLGAISVSITLTQGVRGRRVK